MTDATNTIDTWTATTHADLEQLRAAVLDLIDCGPPDDDREPVLRRPDKELQAAMRRGADRDADYARPPSTRTHTPGRITDTTGDTLLRWETAVAAATADHLTLKHRPAAALIPATTTWRLIDGLLSRGWSKAALGRAITGNPSCQSLQLGRRRVTAATARRVLELNREDRSGLISPTDYAHQATA